MTEEEQIFKKRFPEYCVGEEFLSPFFDFFQIGFEESENRLKAIYKKQRNKRIDELQKQNKQLQEELNEWKSCAECAVKEQKILQEENARLKKDNEQLNFALLSKPKSPTIIIEDEIDTAVKIARAKKIIRLFLSERFNESEWQNIQNQAEAFLKECE